MDVACEHGVDMSVGWCGECSAEAAEIAYEVAEFGAEEQRRAGEYAQAWAEWAADVDRLIAGMPRASYAGPRYMAEDCCKTAVHLGAGHVDPVRLRAHLERAAAGADALSGAWRRAAARTEERTEATVDLLTPRREVSRDGE